jgi:cytoskeleton protein RodZ
VEEEVLGAGEDAPEDTGGDTGGDTGEPAPLEVEVIQGEEEQSSSSGLDLDDLPVAPSELEPAPTLAAQAPSSGDEAISQEPGLEIGAPLADDVVGNNGNALEIPAIPDSVSETAAATGPAVFGSENGETRVRLVATEDCWVQVRNTDGELLLTRVLRPGESYQVPDETGITLFTGNAGGLEIYVDGQKLPLIGSSGEVKRDVLLEPDSLLGNDSSSDPDGLPGTVGSVE